MADSEQPDKNPGGRPLKFETVRELKQKIQDYFDMCDPHTEPRRVLVGHSKEGKAVYEDREVMTDQVPYTITGLARALKTTRDVLLDYESGKYDDRDDTDVDGEKFSNAIKDAKLRVQQDAEERLMSGAAVAGAIFWLKNNAGWRDRQEVTGADGAALYPVALDPTVLNRVQDHGAAPQSPAGNSKG